MHSHDPELIAALAEGSLPADAAEAASAEITRCRRCSADLRAQRAALDAISSAPVAALTDIEADRLRAAVAGALSIDPDAVAEPKRARRVPIGAVAVAAVSLAGIVAIVPVLGLLSTTGDDDTSAPVAAVAIEETEPADQPESEDLRSAPPDESEVPAAGSEHPSAADDAAPEAAEVLTAEETTTSAAAAPPTTTAPDTTESMVAVAPGEGLPPLVAVPDLAGYLADGFRDEDLLTDGSVGHETPCSSEAAEALGPGYLALAPTVLLEDGREAVAFVDGERVSMIVFAGDDCSIALTLP